MKPDHFLSHLQHEQIVEAIRAAERNTTGAIRVFISHRHVTDPLPSAQRQFERMGMHRLHHRNGILIFVAPRSQTFAIMGDRGVHERAGETAWQTLATGMGELFKNHRHMAAIEYGIQKASELLTAHFPEQSPRPS